MADAYICRRGGIGNEREVWIRAYSTEKALLADVPREQTIGVVTGTAITVFSIRPNTPVSVGRIEGGIWIKDNSSTWKSNYLQVINGTGNPPTYIPVFPSGCMQYISDAWKPKPAYFYKGGEWVKFSDEITYVYNAGTTSLSWSGTGTDTSSALVMETSHANYAGSYRSGGWKGSTGKITVPAVATNLCMKYSVSVTTGEFSSFTNTAFGLRSSDLTAYENGNTNFSAYASLSSGSNVTVSVPITTAMQGSSYYIGFHANTGSSNKEVVSKWTVSKIWFE